MARTQTKFLVPRIESLGTIGAMGGINATFVPRDSVDGPGPKNSILEAVKGMQKKISLPKLVQLDDNIRPYLTALMIASVDALQERFIIPNTA